MQTDLQRCEWLRQQGWTVEGVAQLAGESVHWIERQTPDREQSAWLRVLDGMMLWHGGPDQAFADYVRECTEPVKPRAKERSLFED
jgi:hypothetical protein